MRVLMIRSTCLDSFRSSMASMPEMPAAGEDHCQAMLIGSGDHFLIAN
jgi:hypothetical protein